MATGIEVNQETILSFNAFKLRKGGRWMTMQIAPGEEGHNEVLVDRVAEYSEDNWDDFLDALTENDDANGKPDSRYGCYKQDFEKNGVMRDSVVFFLYAPAGAAIRSKMLYSTTMSVVKDNCHGMGHEIQADGLDELDRDELISELIKAAR